jgi:hypothetical protein
MILKFWKISLFWKIIFWNPSHVSWELKLTGLSKMHTNWKSMNNLISHCCFGQIFSRNQKLLTFWFMHFYCIFLNIFFLSWYSPNWPWFSITPSQKMNLRQVFSVLVLVQYSEYVGLLNLTEKSYCTTENCFML